MKYRYDNWVSGLNGDWLDLAAELLRCAVPGLVHRSMRLAIRTTTTRFWPTKTICRSDPEFGGADQGSANPSVARQAASLPIRTSWTPGRRHLSPRRSRAAGIVTRTCSRSHFRWT